MVLLKLALIKTSSPAVVYNTPDLNTEIAEWENQFEGIRCKFRRLRLSLSCAQNQVQREAVGRCCGRLRVCTHRRKQLYLLHTCTSCDEQV